MFGRATTRLCIGPHSSYFFFSWFVVMRCWHGYRSGVRFAYGLVMYRQSEKKLISSTCSHNMVNFGPLVAEIGSVVWGTPANFNGFLVLATLLHSTPVLGVSQTLRR